MKNQLNRIPTRKALNPEYRKHKPKRGEVNSFRTELKNCLVSIKNAEEVNESEEFIKTPIATFLKNTFYGDNLVNTKGRIDLAIYTGIDLKSDVGVIIEAKKPSNKSEFLSEENLNRKALQELLLYYLRERIDNENNNIKTLIATNGYEWYLFKGEDFYKYFYKNTSLIKEYNAFKDGQKDSEKTELFYSEIAKKYIAEIEKEFPFVYLDFTKKGLEDYNDQSLNTLYKVFSDVNILGQSFANDSNELNKSFYNELLHIIGLEETKDKGKKVIYRKDEGKRDYASFLENAIFKLEDQDHLSKVTNYTEDKAFNVGLTLCLTWVNRILFLKLLESQLKTYHPDEKEKYSFLNTKLISGFDDLNDLFFSALAKKQEDRHSKFKDKYQYIPYLNSSLFERSSLETDTIEISALNDEEIEVYKTTVLKENGKRFKGKLSTLEYLFRFLDCFDFATDGTEGISDEEESKTLINASVLGMIFEKINGYKEGSFYTPAYITMYMCKETLRRAVVQKFKEKENEEIVTFEDLVFHCTRVKKLDDIKRLNRVFNSLKVCDPAVGSGHFLVSALNELILIKHELGLLVDITGGSLAKYDIHIENDELYVTDEEGHLIDYKPNNKESARVQHTLFHEKQTIIENCLFGVDINPNSVKICRLRLWIELLKNAYYTKQGVFQTLPNIDINIKCGNSLISRFDLKDDLQNAFKGNDVKYNFSDYKEAAKQYKTSNSKEQKKEVLEIINEVKNNFISSLDDDAILDRQKAVGKYETEKARQDNLILFEEKITKADKKILKELKTKADKAIQKETEIVNNKIYDNAFEWRFEFPEVLDETGNYTGFDVIIGNPPYGATLNNFEKQFLKLRYEYLHKRTIDTYNFFLGLGNEILNSAGNLSYIIPSAYLFQTEFEKSRGFFMNRHTPKVIMNLGENIFKAVVPSCIFIYGKAKIDDTEVYICDTNKARKLIPELNFEDGFMLKLEELNSFSNATIPFNIEEQRLLKLIYDKNHKKLGDICNEVNSGVTTGLKEAFIIPEEISNKFNLEEKVIYPTLEGRNLHQFRIEYNNKVILYTNQDFNPEYYPNSIKYLEQFYEKLSKRSEVLQKIKSWYSLGRARGPELLNPPKIMCRETGDSIIASVDNKGYYPMNTIICIKLIENSEDYCKAITTLLNSKLLNTLFKIMSQEDGRTFAKIRPINLRKLPLPNNLPDYIEKLVVIHDAAMNKSQDLIISEIDAFICKIYDLNYLEMKLILSSECNLSEKEYLKIPNSE